MRLIREGPGARTGLGEIPASAQWPAAQRRQHPFPPLHTPASAPQGAASAPPWGAGWTCSSSGSLHRPQGSAPRVHGTHFSGVPTGAQNKPVSLTPSYGPTGCPLGSKEHLPVTPAPHPALEPWHTLFCQEHRPPCWPPVPHLRACPRPPVLCPIPTLTLHRTGQPDAIPTSCI